MTEKKQMPKCLRCGKVYGTDLRVCPFCTCSTSTIVTAIFDKETKRYREITEEKKPLTRAQQDRETRAHYKKKLAEWLPEGSNVATLQTSVARSGMSGHIRVFIASKDYDGKPDVQDITGYVALVLKYQRTPDGLLVRGCGFDRGFEIVQNLSYELYGMPKVKLHHNRL